MKRKFGEVFVNKFAVMETTVSSDTYVEFMPQLWIIPPRNKIFVHKERDLVKFLFPLRLPQQSKDNYTKYLKQAKFNCVPPERNEKWEMREGRILKMGLASLEEALQAEKFFSDYFSTTEGETQDKVATPAPKKIVRKKKNSVRKQIDDSESEEEIRGDEVSNYNIQYQANDQILGLFNLVDENAILDANINQLVADNIDGVFENENLLQSNEQFVTIDVPTINPTNSDLVQREIFDENQEMEVTGDTIDQQSNYSQTSCCKSHQKVLNKIDYVQKKWSKEMSLLRQETRANRQLLLRVLNLLSPTEVLTENTGDQQVEQSSKDPVQSQIDVAELDRFNAKYKETFPILSSDFIVDFNKSMKDDQKFADYLFTKLSQIKGENETKTARKILKELCDIRCLKDFTWLGTKKMKCFQDLHVIIEMISLLLKEEYPGCKPMDVIASVVKQRTKSAKEAYERLVAEQAARDAEQAARDAEQAARAAEQAARAAEQAARAAKHDSDSVSTERNGVDQGDVDTSFLDNNQAAGTAGGSVIDITAENRGDEFANDSSQDTV